MNELIREKSWGVRHWKWLVPITAFLILVIAIIALQNKATNFVQAYAEPSLYENAIVKARQNERVKEVFGTLESIDKLTILEGNVVYSENQNAVDLTFRVVGTKASGKMDIQAHKNEGDWEYDLIKIRAKDGDEVISIFPNE